MVNETVSVVIPTYNRAECVETAVRSVLAQTHTDLEVLVIDDGSTDDTSDVIASIRDSRVQYHPGENMGACAARNRGIALATGAYIAFQDSDDEWLPEKVATQLAAMNQQGFSVAMCRMRSTTPAGRMSLVPGRRFRQDHVTLANLLRKNFVSTQMLIGRAEIIRTIHFDPLLPRCQDWDYAIQLLQKHQILFVDDVLVEQRIRTDSISTDDERLRQAYIRLAIKYRELLREHPHAHAAHLRYFANAMVDIDPQAAEQAYRDSLAHHLTLPTMLRYLYARVVARVDQIGPR